VTPTTKSDPIVRIVAQIGEGSPRFDMVDFEFSTLRSTILTCPIIPFQTHRPKFNISRRVKVFVSYLRRPVNPIWVIRPHEMCICGRDVSSPLNALSNVFFVFGTQYSTTISFRYSQCSFFPNIWSHQMGIATQFSRSGYFCARGRCFCRICSAVCMYHLAGIAAKIFIALRFRLPAYDAVGVSHEVFSIPDCI